MYRTAKFGWTIYLCKIEIEKNIKKIQEFGLINAVAARLRKLARKGPTILWSHESEMAAECRRSDAPVRASRYAFRIQN
jgi:hypothetical protein